MTPCPVSPISSSRRWSARSAMAPATGLISTPAIVASSVQVTAAEPDGITSSTSATRLAPEPADEIALLSQRYRKRGRSRRMLTDPRVSGRVSWRSNFGLSRNEGLLRPGMETWRRSGALHHAGPFRRPAAVPVRGLAAHGDDRRAALPGAAGPGGLPPDLAAAGPAAVGGPAPRAAAGHRVVVRLPAGLSR